MLRRYAASILNETRHSSTPVYLPCRKRQVSFREYENFVGVKDWSVGRLSREPGILICSLQGFHDVVREFSVGKKISVYVQHAGITAGAAFRYIVVDEDDVVREMWYPRRGLVLECLLCASSGIRWRIKCGMR